MKICEEKIDNDYCTVSILQECTLAAAYSKGKDQPGKDANPARGQLNTAEQGK